MYDWPWGFNSCPFIPFQFLSPTLAHSITALILSIEAVPGEGSRWNPAGQALTFGRSAPDNDRNLCYQKISCDYCWIGF